MSEFKPIDETAPTSNGTSNGTANHTPESPSTEDTTPRVPDTTDDDIPAPDEAQDENEAKNESEAPTQHDDQAGGIDNPIYGGAEEDQPEAPVDDGEVNVEVKDIGEEVKVEGSADIPPPPPPEAPSTEE